MNQIGTRVFILLSLLFLFGIASSDDGGVSIQSGAAVLIEEHPDISMADEYVLIEMHSENYRVKAKFDFFNSGKSTTVAVGFPVSGKFAFGEGTFTHFRTWVDGKVSETQNVPDGLDSPADTGSEWFEYYKVKQVYFPSQSTTTTIVDYEATYGRSIGGPIWLKYTYGTGKSWRGPIGTAIFDLRFDESLFGLDVSFAGSGVLVHRAPGQMIFKFVNLNPAEADNFMVSYEPWRYCTDASNGGDDPEMQTNYCSSRANMEIGGNRGVPHKFPTLGSLRLQRNAVYAKHGRIFKDSVLSAFFKNLTWYSPRPKYKDSDLSLEEKMEIRKISVMEGEIGARKVIPAPFSIPR